MTLVSTLNLFQVEKKLAYNFFLIKHIFTGEYAQLLSINFTPPTLDQEPVASFGVIISAANIALSALHKVSC